MTTPQSLMGALLATDVDNDASDLGYHHPGAGKRRAAAGRRGDHRLFAAVFTQADLDNGRVSFRFNTLHNPGDEIRVIEDDSLMYGQRRQLEHRRDDLSYPKHHGADLGHERGRRPDQRGVQPRGRDLPRPRLRRQRHHARRLGRRHLDGGGHVYRIAHAWLYTQEGGDTVDYGASSAAVDIDLTREAQSGGHAEGDVLIGVENVIGSGFDDSITGDAAANLLSGLGGDDTLLGGEGNDTLRGGAGTDLINGGLGWDFADYRDSASWVNVDLNIQDGLTAQSGGGADNDALGDTLVGIEHLIGSNDASHGDVLTGNALSNHLIGLEGDDTLIGNAGNDTFVGGAGADRQDGGTGYRDLADYSARTEWVNVDLTKQDGTTAQSGGGAGNHAEGDILTGIECVNGSAHDDSILGNTVDNVIFSYGGNDTVFAGNGYDTVNGGVGEDFIDGGGHPRGFLFGGAGNDTINGSTGIDSVWGGSGDDSFTAARATPRTF